jgi:hypothetical protein
VKWTSQQNLPTFRTSVQWLYLSLSCWLISFWCSAKPCNPTSAQSFVRPRPSLSIFRRTRRPKPTPARFGLFKSQDKTSASPLLPVDSTRLDSQHLFVPPEPLNAPPAKYCASRTFFAHLGHPYPIVSAVLIQSRHPGSAIEHLRRRKRCRGWGHGPAQCRAGRRV